MKLYRENRLDGEFTMSVSKIADAYLDSEFSSSDMPLERSLATFMAHPDGLNASWDDGEAFQRIVSAVLERI